MYLIECTANVPAGNSHRSYCVGIEKKAVDNVKIKKNQNRDLPIKSIRYPNNRFTYKIIATKTPVFLLYGS